eukprot:11219909-Alexandrium_andersonii.AAC.1
MLLPNVRLILRKAVPWHSDCPLERRAQPQGEWVGKCRTCMAVVRLVAKPAALRRGWPRVHCPGCDKMCRVGCFLCGGCGAALKACLCNAKQATLTSLWR